MSGLIWSRLEGAPGSCAILPDRRPVHIVPATKRHGWIARVSIRPGASPSTYAYYATEAEARAWAERLAVALEGRAA